MAPRRHRARQRKPDNHTFDLLDCTRIPKALQDTPERFSTILHHLGRTAQHDARPDFVRYCEDVLKPLARHMISPSWHTIANESAAAFRHWEHLAALEKKLVADLNRGDTGHEEVLKTYRKTALQAEQSLINSVLAAKTALNRVKYHGNQDVAMLLEVPYMALRGSKALLIVAHQRGGYRAWPDHYKWLWALQYGQSGGWGEEFDEADLEDQASLELRPWQTKNLKPHSPRPMWWDQMELAAFNRTVRRLVPIDRQTERPKRLHTPAMLYHWRTRSKRSKPLSDPLGIAV